jgi:hypothetical protein
MEEPGRDHGARENSFVDTAEALNATNHRDEVLLHLKMTRDACSYAYDKLNKANSHWQQMIMVVATTGAFSTAVLALADKTGWPFELVPILVQTVAGAMAAWVRFYDFPRRMEELINVKHQTSDILESVRQSATITEELWAKYTSAITEVEDVMTPSLYDKAHKNSTKTLQRALIREARVRELTTLSDEQLARKGARPFKDSDEDSPLFSSMVSAGALSPARLGRRVSDQRPSFLSPVPRRARTFRSASKPTSKQAGGKRRPSPSRESDGIDSSTSSNAPLSAPAEVVSSSDESGAVVPVVTSV